MFDCFDPSSASQCFEWPPPQGPDAPMGILDATPYLSEAIYSEVATKGGTSSWDPDSKTLRVTGRHRNRSGEYSTDIKGLLDFRGTGGLEHFAVRRIHLVGEVGGLLYADTMETNDYIFTGPLRKSFWQPPGWPQVTSDPGSAHFYDGPLPTSASGVGYATMFYVPGDFDPMPGRRLPPAVLEYGAIGAVEWIPEIDRSFTTSFKIESILFEGYDFAPEPKYFWAPSDLTKERLL